jgi:hypothetical protein
MYNKMEISVKRQKAYEKPKRNSEAENYSDWNKKVTRGIQRQIWVGRRKNQWVWRKNKGNDQVWGEKRLNKSEQSKGVWGCINQHMCRSSRARRNRIREKRIYEEVMSEIFQNLMKDMNTNIKGAQ